MPRKIIQTLYTFWRFSAVSKLLFSRFCIVCLPSVSFCLTFPQTKNVQDFYRAFEEPHSNTPMGKETLPPAVLIPIIAKVLRFSYPLKSMQSCKTIFTSRLNPINENGWREVERNSETILSDPSEQIRV